MTVQANIREGVQADPIRQAIAAELGKADLESRGIRWKMAGADEEQAAAGAFLGKAFGAALFLIFLVIWRSSTTSSRSG